MGLLLAFLLPVLIHRLSTPNDDQLVIKVIYAGSNPKDW